MSDTHWLDDGEQRAWRAYLQMNRLLAAALSRAMLADSKLSISDFEVLVALTDVSDSRLRVSDLARALHWEKSRLSHQIARMARRGLVAREDCPEDARGSFVALTPAGRHAIEAAAPAHVETVRRLFFDVLTDNDVAALRTLSERVLSGLEPATAAPSVARAPLGTAGEQARSTTKEAVRVGADDKMRNMADKVAGEAKEKMGKATDDEQTEGEGKTEQSESDLKQAGEKAKDAFGK